MASLFYISGSPAKPNIGDSNFEAHYPDVNRNKSWSQLEPYIRQAEQKFIIPFLCKDFYAELVANDLGSPTAIDEEIIELTRDALAYYTIHHAMPHINMIISDQGLMENSSSDGTAAPVTMWRYKNTRWETINHADDTLDRLLQRLEELVAEGETDVDTWKDSDCFTSNVSCLFRSTQQLRECIHMKRSRRTFVALVPFLKKAEEQFVRTVLCDDQYDRICAGIIAGDLTAEEENLLAKCRPVSANYGLLKAIPHLRIQIEDDGLKMVSSTDGMNMKQNASETAIAQLRAQLEADAKTAQADLREFLYANADDYPDWTASDCYIDPDDIDNQQVLPENHTGAIIL